ncbi:MAG: histidinol dehydrogenase, partial [Deltaproteobacteria bacterium]|nr:histidinol dehydrogenase [Deltaproteobacteria bacterium]
MKIRVIKTSDPAFKPTLRRIIGRRGEKEAKVEKRVAEIIQAVKKGGDRALIRFTRRFDGIRLSESTLEVPQKEIDRAVNRISREDLRVLRLAARRIAAFHRRQLEKSWGYRDALGLFLGQKITPLARVGVYVPGGKASYPSTVLMNAIPAKVAGVKEIIMASPLGLRNDGAAILAAARIAGVDRIFRVGGAQAISALAFGTESVPKVDKIVGPGNIYVAAAKRMVFGEVDIDSIAGPSEILLLADAHADPSHVAADMLSQAEHDELAAALCVTPSPLLARRVEAALAGQLQKTRRRAITVKALRRYGAIIICRGL